MPLGGVGWGLCWAGPVPCSALLCHSFPVPARAAMAGIPQGSAPGQAHRAAPPSPVRALRNAVLGTGQCWAQGRPSSRQDPTPLCSCQGLLPCAQEQSLHPGPALKPGHESTCKGSDSHITRKLIFLPPSANKAALDSSQSLFLPSQSITACCVSGAGLWTQALCQCQTQTSLGVH